ncbi:MAG: 6-pyruvoyl trahydropterin synthase family protein [Phycisphaeraceae bacterium]
MQYQATVEREFCAAHALRLPDGSLEPRHGHNWRVWVTVARGDLDELETVIDFHQLEASLDAVLAPWQNADLNEQPIFQEGGYNPSAERVSQAIAEALMPALTSGVELHSVRVSEAPGCTATVLP